MEEEQEKRDKSEAGTGGGSDRTLQAWLAGIAIGCLVLAAMIVAYEIGKNNADTQVTADVPAATSGGSAEEPVAAGPGASAFTASCGSCHTLEAAGTTATVGPNLDDLQPDSALVLSAIENGGAGSGAMPPALLSGEEAQQVADFVAESSGSGK
ncbi:MAG: cytochrome c [Solirubrobacterales bacterium]|nr:cytochrome c [Solirubrobacterales bacterium]HMT05955.1 cytochrome c [Solirubrobacterales bacterium]